MATAKQLEEEIKKIKERNIRVEIDKAWETSWARKILIGFMTYAVVALFFIAANLPNPFVNSLVPVAAFLLSTLTLSAFKKAWIENRNRKQ